LLIEGKHNQQGVVELSDDEGTVLSDVVEVVAAFSVAVAVVAVVALVLLVEFGVAGIAGVVSPMFVGCVAVALIVFAKSGSKNDNE